MSDIHPTSIALLAVLAATAAVIALDLAIGAVRRWRQARRWRADEDIVIDLTYFQQAVRRTEEASRDLESTPGMSGR